MAKKAMQLKQKTTTTNDIIESFIINCTVRGLSESTLYNYEHTCKMFNDVIGRNIKNITSKDIDKFVLYLRSRGNNNTSILTRIKVLKAFFTFAGIDVQMPSIKTDKSVKVPYTQEEIELLLKKPTINSYTQWRNHAIVSTFLGTGIRCRTLQNLKVKDINFNDNTIFLEATKTRKKYYIPMSSTLKQTLKYYLSLFDHNSEDYLFMSLYGDQLTREGLKQTIRDYNLKKGVSKTSIHLFRHTFAYNYLKNGGNIVYLQEILGHSNIETTRMYLHVTNEDLQQNFDNICPLDNMKRKGIKLKKN